MGKFGFKWLALAGVVVAVFVAGWLASASAGGRAAPGSASATETVTTTVTAKEGKDEGKGGEAEPAATSAEGSRVVWRGPLVEEHGLNGSQLDAVYARVRECLPIERAHYLELCLQNREQDWFDEGGTAPSTPAEDAE
ncbi:hypothetical protein [Corynebacterium xerosis]|uniref:Secreted protein n=1 Tax=Corynebacterium xerosis TaxID=1725 RepID=A0ABV3UWN6_9CORY